MSSVEKTVTASQTTVSDAQKVVEAFSLVTSSSSLIQLVIEYIGPKQEKSDANTLYLMTSMEIPTKRQGEPEWCATARKCAAYACAAYRIAMGPGQYMASACAKQVWQQEIRPPNCNRVLCGATFPNGDFLVAVESEDRSCSLRKYRRDGAFLAQFPHRISDADKLVVVPDGKSFLLIGKDIYLDSSQFILYSAAGKEKKCFSYDGNEKGTIHSIAFYPSGDRFLIGFVQGLTQTIEEWDLRDSARKPIVEWNFGASDILKILPDGRGFMRVHRDEIVCFFSDGKIMDKQVPNVDEPSCDLFSDCTLFLDGTGAFIKYERTLLDTNDAVLFRFDHQGKIVGRFPLDECGGPKIIPLPGINSSFVVEDLARGNHGNGQLVLCHPNGLTVLRQNDSESMSRNMAATPFKDCSGLIACAPGSEAFRVINFHPHLFLEDGTLMGPKGDILFCPASAPKSSSTQENKDSKDNKQG